MPYSLISFIVFARKNHFNLDCDAAAYLLIYIIMYVILYSVMYLIIYRFLHA